MRRALVMLSALAAAASGCAAAPRGGTDGEPWEVDSSATVWGDEHAGLLIEDDRAEVTQDGAFNLEGVEGNARSLRLAASAGGARAQARTSATGTFGAVEWGKGGVVRHVVLGAVRPVLAEGALAGDPREAAELRARASARAGGLRLEPSSSSWGTVLGGGLVVAPGRFRASAGAWQPHADAGVRAGFASLERRGARVVTGVAGGWFTGPGGEARAVSAFAASGAEQAFVSGEVALAPEGTRVVARALLGERREWRALFVAGTRPPPDAGRLSGAREQWGGSVERRDTFARGTSRLLLAASTRRAPASESRRRRIAWEGNCRLSPEARLEVAARATRDLDREVEDAVLGVPLRVEVRDEWRARATLRARRPLSSAWSVENAYRIDLVGARRERPGTLATWTCKVRWAGHECRFSASAAALREGQLGYAPNPGVVGTSAFAVVTGRAAYLSASLRSDLGAHTRLGGAWTWRGDGVHHAYLFLTIHG